MTTLERLFDLTGRVAIVTGGSRGLGLQIAEALGEFGATVVLVARKQPELDSAVEHLEQLGIRADSIAADVTDPNAASTLVAQIVERHERVDILVNNAGATWGAKAEEHTLEAWEKVMAVNLTGTFLLTQSVARRCFLPNAKGVVINISSVEGLAGHHPRMTPTIAYNTAKGAVINFTRALAAEWGPKGIRVNAIAPGFFPTRMTTYSLEHFGDFLLERTPLGRFGNEDDLKGTALLLASDASAHITGQIFVVDGGLSII